MIDVIQPDQIADTGPRDNGIEPKSVRALERGLGILELLAQSESGLPLAAIASRVGLPPATARRLLNTLIKQNYVVQDELTRQYYLGLQVLTLRLGAVREIQMADRARPHLVALMRETRLRTHLGVLNNGDVVYVDRVETPDSITVFSETSRGTRAPAHATALGKVLLAFSDPDRVTGNLRTRELVGRTPNTIRDPERLLQELRVIRERQFALDDAEAMLGVRCIAGPIRDYTGRVVAAISAAGEAEAIPDDRVPEVAVSVQRAGRAISLALGFHNSTGTA